MVLFFFKKALFDFWDHLVSITLINLGYFGIAAFVLLVPTPAQPLHILSFFIYLIKFSLFFIYTGVVNRIIRKYVEYSSASFGDFLPSLKASWLSSFLFSIFISGLVLIIFVAFDYITKFPGSISIFGIAVLFWLILICLLSLPFFYAFEAGTDSKFLTCIKKCILMFMDNVIFSIGLLMGSVLISGISFVFLFLLPGLGALLLWYNVAVLLRSKKYGYLRENPIVKGRNIPWKEILNDDIQRMSSRTFKGLLFPWKE